jgi:L-aspartate oxidase
MAVALRAGAVLRDLEFVQFHPTVMYLGPDSRGQQPLISEAVRGEGAFLVDFEGNRFMQGRARAGRPRARATWSPRRSPAG